MSYQKTLAALLAAGLVAGSWTSLAADPEGGPGRREGREERGARGPDLNRLAERLNLSAEQKQNAQNIRNKYMSQHRTQIESMRPLREQLGQLLRAEQVNLDQVRAKLQQISAIHVELRMLKIRERLEFEALLTPEQRQQLRRMRPERPNRGDEDRRPPGPPPFDDEEDV